MIKNTTKLLFLIGLTGLQAIESIPNAGNNPEIQQLQEQNIIKQQAQDIYTKTYNSYVTKIKTLKSGDIQILEINNDDFFYYFFSNPLWRLYKISSEMSIFPKDLMEKHFKQILINIDKFHDNAVKQNDTPLTNFHFNKIIVHQSNFFKILFKFYLNKLFFPSLIKIGDIKYYPLTYVSLFEKTFLFEVTTPMAKIKQANIIKEFKEELIAKNLFNIFIVNKIQHLPKDTLNIIGEF